MSDASRARTPIDPLPAGAARPRWSVMIPTFDCASYLRETLRSVLAQDPGPDVMQIEVVDDHSTRDDPEAVVRELGAGRVGFYRQAANVGHVRNFNSCLERARGELVHLLHGDDLVREGFYGAMQAAFERDPAIGAAFCRYITVDGDGIWLAVSELVQRQRGTVPGFLDLIGSGQRLQVASMVVRREIYEQVGGFDDRIRAIGEDWEMWVRVAAACPVAYEPEPLAIYRRHGSSLTGHARRDGRARLDIERVIELNRQHLPASIAQDVTRRARRWWATAMLREGRQRYDGGQLAFPASAIGDAWAIDHSPAIALRAMWLASLWLVRVTQSALGAPHHARPRDVPPTEDSTR